MPNPAIRPREGHRGREHHGVGALSRVQIEAVLRIKNMKEESEASANFVMCLRRHAASAVPADEQSAVMEFANHLSTMYHTYVIHGLKYDYLYSLLYPLAPPSWLNGDGTSAFCERLEQDHGAVKYGGILTARRRGARSLTQQLDDSVVTTIKSASDKDIVQTLLFPINLNNSHWCCVIVDRATRRVLSDDSMNSGLYRIMLEKMAWEIARTLADAHEVVKLNSPLQFDGCSCGYFVCLKFWRHVDSHSRATPLNKELWRSAFASHDTPCVSNMELAPSAQTRFDSTCQL